MAQTDRPTKDDKAEECRSLETAVWCARLLEPLEICRVSVWSTPCTEGLSNPAQLAPLDYYTAAHNAYMHPLRQSFLLVSRKKKNPDLSFSNDRKVCEIRDGENVRESEGVGVGYARDRNIHRDEDAETKKQRV